MPHHLVLTNDTRFGSCMIKDGLFYCNSEGFQSASGDLRSHLIILNFTFIKNLLI